MEWTEALVKIFPAEAIVHEIAKSVERKRRAVYDLQDIKTEATRIISLAHADVEASKILAQGYKEILAINPNAEMKDGKLQILSADNKELSSEAIALILRTQQQTILEEVRKQVNFEITMSKTADLLEQESDIRSEPVADEFKHRWKENVKNISDDELQSLWARILAGEIKQPRSFSLRTLDLIKNLNKDEAELINKVANFAFKLHGETSLFRGSDEGLDRADFSGQQIKLLIEIGILQTGFSLVHEIKGQPGIPIFLYYGDYTTEIRMHQHASSQTLPVYLFTRAGVEILRLIKKQTDFSYLQNLISYIKSSDNTITYRQMLGEKDGQPYYTHPQHFN